MADLPMAAPVLVDAVWYLRTYPDVAAAGADPQQHYQLHGRAEGRLPRPLRALRLEDALWGGFARLALPELQAWLQQTTDPDECASAAWALARWYASHGQWQAALPLLQWLESALPPWLDHAGPVLLGVEVLLRNGQREQAHARLREAMACNRALPDLCLAAANARLPAGAGRPQPDAALRLGWINAVFTSADLAPISLRDPLSPLSLDNLHAQPPQVGEWAEQAQPKISVIMPAFNAAAFIETALRSLQAQTWQNLEILVIDDCSSDDTCERVAAMAREDARILLLRQSCNGGAYAARNAALQRASGEYLVNHDSDDWSHPQRLEQMAQPLLQRASLVGTLADWVRTDTTLHFQNWRIVDRLIEPSVSTFMVRKAAVQQLGGWDEVRVAADHELCQRILQVHGPDSIAHVLQGIPLVLARQLPESLTMAPATHLRSLFFGLRRLYSELAQTWYGMVDTPAALRLSPSAKRAFPAPAPMLRTAQATAHYDYLLIADLSAESRTALVNRAQVQRLLALGAKVALFHWPEYQRPEPIDPLFLRHAVQRELDVVLAEQRLEVEHVLVVGRHLLAKPLDRVSRLRFQSIRLVDEAPGEPISTVDAPDLFAAQWYLQRYPDVRAAGIDPWQHYLQHGAAEGRDPGPNFNTAHYLAQSAQARDSGMPALLHYQQIGRDLGLDPRPPFLPGRQAHRPGRPTVLLCAHAAERQLFGAERCLLDVLDACVALELNVLVSVPSLVNVDYVSALQARSRGVACIPHIPWQAQSALCAVAVQRFTELIHSHGIDLVQANTLTLREPLIAARNVGVPAYVHIHESPAHDPDLAGTICLPAERIVEQVLASADVVLANSAFTARQFAKPGATHVAGNIIDAATFDLPNDIDPHAITAALISSNLPKKGLQDIQALAQLLAQDTPNLRLLLIGPDNEHVAQLRAQQAYGNLPTNLLIRPYTDTPQAAIAQANIVLNLSHCQETFGRTALEGLAAGRPVIGYGHGALPELIEDGVDGYLAEPGDIAAVAAHLRQLCQNPQRILDMGEAGRRTARGHDLSRLCRQLERAYVRDLPMIKVDSCKVG
ncbi:glycosyltransferase [Stutzerimonas stutzeri]|uniref:Glycosyltransferase n=1 Tax=Stutzerimonas stutzeri TaxID=316 RepID=A0A2N8RFU9_STUST|nr:glycosyltransferase [Stutzerimonas stutzeri]MCQ4253831.1 glycosyltransferase [Stutzerimonas stutzeri]PNF59964.1 glycosyltransferase [Stutzerimonas stutzeri]